MLEKPILAHILQDHTILQDLTLRKEMFSPLGQIIIAHVEENGQVNEALLIAEVGDKLEEYIDLAAHLDIDSTEALAKMMIEDYNRSLHIKATHQHYLRLTDGKDTPEESFDKLEKDIESGIVEKADKFQTRSAVAREIREEFGQPSQGILETGIVTWENVVGGIFPNHLIYTGANPGTGKTQFVLEQMYHLAIQGYTCLFFSLEMSEKDCFFRLMSIHTRIPFYTIKSWYYGKGKPSSEAREKLAESYAYISDLPIIIVDNAYYLSEIKSQSKMYHRKYNLSYIGIDYAQEIQTSQRFERDELRNSHISRELMKLRKDVCTINVLSQLNEKGKLRGGGWNMAADEIYTLWRSLEEIMEFTDDPIEQKFGMVTKCLKFRPDGSKAGQSWLNIFKDGQYKHDSDFIETDTPF